MPSPENLPPIVQILVASSGVVTALLMPLFIVVRLRALALQIAKDKAHLAERQSIGEQSRGFFGLKDGVFLAAILLANLAVLYYAGSRPLTGPSARLMVAAALGMGMVLVAVLVVMVVRLAWAMYQGVLEMLVGQVELAGNQVVLFTSIRDLLARLASAPGAGEDQTGSEPQLPE